MGFAIGVGTLIYAFMRGHENMVVVGAVYVCLSLALLGARQAMQAASDARQESSRGSRDGDDAEDQLTEASR